MIVRGSFAGRGRGQSGESRMRYHGEGLYQWDTWCHVAPDGLVHAFYLSRPDRTGTGAAGGGQPRSRDQSEPDRLGGAARSSLRPTGRAGDLVNWTGSTIRVGDSYYLFYTIRSSLTVGRVQAIGMATSDDLWTWTKHPDNPVLTPTGGGTPRRRRRVRTVSSTAVT